LFVLKNIIKLSNSDWFHFVLNIGEGVYESMDERLFRDAMGKFATGVTVVVTELNGEIFAATVNAFMSVSLNPMLILISLNKTSQTLNKIKQRGLFTVNVLNKDQINISNHFASKKKSTKEIEFDFLDGMPVIPSTLAQIICTVSSEYEEGDHVLIVGKVTNLQIFEGEPLIFLEGGYRTLKEKPGQA